MTTLHGFPQPKTWKGKELPRILSGLFQVDNGPNLNNPNNVFTNSNGIQDIQNAFTTGGYNLRAIADPAYPNIGFAPFLP